MNKTWMNYISKLLFISYVWEEEEGFCVILLKNQKRDSSFRNETNRYNNIPRQKKSMISN